ncbi:MAG: alpha-mannosidase, partial [Butyricicoccus sp.]
EILLTECAAENDSFELVIEGWSGLDPLRCTFLAEAVSIDRDTEAVYYDVLTARDAIFWEKQTSAQRTGMLNALLHAINLIDFRQPQSEAYQQSMRAAHAWLQKELFEAYQGGNGTSVMCTGHAHIDVAWRWCLHHSRKKAARSFSTALDLFEQYPDYHFSSSQPQLYQFIKEDYPDLYEKIKRYAAEGRFEPEGALWVESDCNLISGESFARQLIYGKRFFREEFGVESKVVWLPDVFGYNAAMPQIMRKAHVPYFITSKISWNDTNRMPHDTFYWEGIDGSRVLTYLHTMPPEQGDPEHADQDFYATYNGQIMPYTVGNTYEKYKDKAINSHLLASFGHGDGGGGATRRDLEYAKRMKAGLPNLPQVKLDKIRPFMEELEENIKGKPVPTWCGELYLEYHRGTYTSMAQIKMLNRRTEFAMHNLEFIAALAALKRGTAYPHAEIDAIWPKLLKNQFHDILPGSSIEAVYVTAVQEYEDMLSRIGALTAPRVAALCSGASDETLCLVNDLGFVRGDVVVLPHTDAKAYRTADGRVRPIQ